MSNIRSLAIELKQSNYTKKAIKLLVSVSVFSIILSFPSLVGSLVHYFHVYISSNIFPLVLISYMFDKNYMFLVCNGLLVFIVIIGNSPSGIGLNSDEHVVKINGNYNVELRKALYSEEQVDKKVHKDQVREIEHLFAEIQEEEEKEEILVVEDGVESRGSELMNMKIEDNGINGDEGIELLSTEELNKIFDEFIKRKKEEIIFGA